MTIPVSSIVDVSIAIGATYPERAGFGTLMVVTAETGVISLAERVRSYSSIDGVTADWGASTEVVAAATAYFSQQPKPTSLKVGMRYESAQSAQLRSGAVSTDLLSSFQAVTDGEFTLSIDGVEEDITVATMAGAADMDAVAALIETGVQVPAAGGFTAATVTHDGSRFFITSGTSGITSTISFATDTAGSGTDISSLMQCRTGEATKTAGIAAETITASLTAIQNVDEDWYGLAFTKEVRDLVQVNAEGAVAAAAVWCEARVKVFFNTSNDYDVQDSVDTTNIGYVLNATGYRRTMTTYSSTSDQYPSCSAAGRAFTVNFSQADSTITLKFKQLPGITVEAPTTSQKAAMDAINVNAYVTVGDSAMFAESYMADGTFFDEVHGVDWLTNAIQTNVFGYLLTRTTKVPYTNKGVAALEQQVVKALDEAVLNGLIAPGEDIAGEFYGTGYKVTTVAVEDTNQSDIDAREYNGISFVVLGAGAIHGVQINGVFER